MFFKKCLFMISIFSLTLLTSIQASGIIEEKDSIESNSLSKQVQSTSFFLNLPFELMDHILNTTSYFENDSPYKGYEAYLKYLVKISFLNKSHLKLLSPHEDHPLEWFLERTNGSHLTTNYPYKKVILIRNEIGSCNQYFKLLPRIEDLHHFYIPTYLWLIIKGVENMQNRQHLDVLPLQHISLHEYDSKHAQLYRVGSIPVLDLSSNTNLTYLNLDNCIIRQKEAQAFKDHKTLLFLTLKNCRITNEEAKILAENKTVISLNVSYNGIKNEGAQYLAGNKTLTSLDLSYNKTMIDNDFVQAFGFNINLLHLNLKGSGVSQSAYCFLKSVFPKVNISMLYYDLSFDR